MCLCAACCLADPRPSLTPEQQAWLAKAKRFGQDALQMLGISVPTTLLGQIPSLIGQIGLRVLQRWMPSRFAVTTPEARERRVWATRVLNRLTEINIYAEDALGCMDSGLRELNTMEPVGPSAELGKAYAVMAVLVGTSGVRQRRLECEQRGLTLERKAWVDEWNRHHLAYRYVPTVQP